MESIKIEPNDDRYTDTDHNKLAAAMSVSNNFESNRESEGTLKNLLNRLSGLPNTSVSKKKTLICREEEVPYQGKKVIKSEITIEEEFFGDEVLDTLTTETEPILSSDVVDKQHFDGKPFCTLCNKQFSTRSSFLRHQRVHTGELFECEICYKKLPGNMRQHMLTHEPKVFKCDHCDRRFSSLQYLQRHKKRTSVRSEKPTEKQFECEICHRKCADLDALMKHREIHFADTPFECKNCEKRFITIQQLNRHEKIHSGIKQHKCLSCGKRFLTASNLWQHELTHRKDKDVQCDQCDKQFAAIFQLKRHKQRVHSVILKPKKPLERLFQCEYCDKKFTSRSIVNRHEKIHTGEKPFGCAYCTKRFAFSSNLQQHEITHLDEKEKTISCDQCDKRFAAMFQLRKHTKRFHTVTLEPKARKKLVHRN